MSRRGAERPDDYDDQRTEQTGRGRRLFGRGRPEPLEQEVPREETGWLDDLRTAKEQGGSIGPGTAPGEARTSKSGRRAPGPDDPDGDDPFPPAPASPPPAAAPSSPAAPRPAGGPRPPVAPASPAGPRAGEAGA
ncbi:hypothetical protein ACFOHP_33530, partial [Couchioplanes caeruleus subsp. azureus]|uniref:hypothetical protein n=1 Tax=Couchioplanes caeruleus TaxID=56438 RepID=UPI003607B26A